MFVSTILKGRGIPCYLSKSDSFKTFFKSLLDKTQWNDINEIFITKKSLVLLPGDESHDVIYLDKIIF